MVEPRKHDPIKDFMKPKTVSMVKRQEQFQINLRKKKRDEILYKKREKIKYADEDSPTPI